MESSSNNDAAQASPTKSTTSTLNNTDDESITTTSTESETYDEAWTLVTDKNRQRIKLAKEASERCAAALVDNRSGATTDTDHDEAAEAAEQLPETSDSNAVLHAHTADDELSDGISIISESESAGRQSPQHHEAEPLSYLHYENTALPRAKLNFPIMQSASAVDGIEDVLENKQLKRRRRSSPRNAQKPETAITEQKALKRLDVFTQINEMPPIIRRGLSGLFYVSVAIVAVALMGKFRMLVWEPLTAQSNAQNLEQKLSDLELQNNLMRAEIDLLTKQVNYLNNLNEQRGGRSYQQPPPQQYEKRKTFKAWSGNGNNIEPIVITKADLKRPYKCADGKFVEIAGMCVENKASRAEEDVVNIVDPVSNIINNVLDKSDTLREFVKVAEQVNAFVDNPFEAVQEKLADVKAEQPQQAGEMPQPPTAEQRRKQWQQQRGEERYQKDYKRQYNDRENTQERNYQHKPAQQRHNHDNPNDHYKRHESKERFAKYNADGSDKSNERRRQDSSRERKDANAGKPHYPSTIHNSKERYESKHARHVVSADERHKDGQWHEQMMREREQVRRQRQDHERNEKNWYIKRGDSRERMRYQ